MSARTFLGYSWLYVAAYLAWGAAMLTGHAPRGLANDLLFAPIYFGAAVAAFMAAATRSADRRRSRGFMLIGLAWAASATGSLLWTVWSYFPSAFLDWAAWTFYNSFFPLTLAGLWQLAELPKSAVTRARLVVDALIVMLATATLAWYSVFRFSGAAELPSRLGVLSPGELLVVFGAAILVYRSTDGDTAWPTWLGFGTYLGSLVDFLYDHHKLVGTIWSGPAADMMLAIVGGLIITGCLLSRAQALTERSKPQRTASTGLSILPYAAIVVVASLLISEFWQRDVSGAIAGLILGGAGLMALLIGRLHVSQREIVSESEARAAQDARFRSLVLRSSDATLVIDGRGTIRYASPAFARMIGAGDARWEQRQLSDFVDGDVITQLLARLPGAPSLPERWRIHCTQTEREAEAIATDLRGDPSVQGIVINLRDITERVQLEEQLRRSQKLEVVGRLSSSIAHDFNNVLTVVLANVHLAQLEGHGTLDEEWAAVGAAARRGAVLSRQLLALSRPTPPRTRTLDLAKEVSAMQKTLLSVLPSSLNLTIRTPPDDEGVPVRLDDVQVEQVLLNLALNARDAMPLGGQLTIVVTAIDIDDGYHGPEGLKAGPWARMTVTDNGSGMDAEILSQALEPFFTTKPSGMGTGLGLSTVKNIVSAAGGVMTIASRVNEGSCVTVYLPRVARAVATLSSPATPRPLAGQGHVLVVDDEPAVRGVIATYLTRLGYTVSEAGDGVEGLDRLDAEGRAVDLVLTDLVMPRMTGEEFGRRVRVRAPQLPIICMSGTPGSSGVDADPWSALQLLPKPISLPLLSSRIASVLNAGVPTVV